MKPTVYFATDHAGFELKNVLLAFVRDELHYDVVDCGPMAFDTQDDYPDFISIAAKSVSKTPTSRAIILGGSGQGEAMVANRFPHVRATAYYGGSDEILTLSREHNDANILSLGARFLTETEAKEAVTQWLEGTFSGDNRHVRRIKKIEHVTK
ncbi:MAG: ribose 5-phosphate isomerase B [Acidimicrobiales bacterium]|jgi:ribose 5-phosphate isomerase B